MSWFNLIKEDITVDNSDLSFITVNSSGSKMNGQVLSEPNPTNVAIINDIYIDEKNRGRGLGKKMFEAFKNALPSTVDTIRGDVVSSAAKPFWEKMGFTTEDGRNYFLNFR